MCLGISTPDGGKTKLIFVQEQIKLEINGKKEVRTDFLIQNVCGQDIRRFRLELPCRLITKDDVMAEENETLQQAYSRLCREQCSKILICTNKLTTPDKPENWIYQILPYLNNVQWLPKQAEIRIELDGKKSIIGLVKQDWRIAVSSELGEDPHRWYALFSNGITVVDFVSVGNQLLKPTEAMWMTVQFTVPKGGMQHVVQPHSFKRLFSRKWGFQFSIMSPRAFSEWRTSQLNYFDKIQRTEGKADPDLSSAVSHLIVNLTASHFAEVEDWRIFLHWSRRMSVQRVDKIEEIIEPPSGNIYAKLKGKGLKKSMVPDENCRGEYRFGSEHGSSEGVAGYRLIFNAEIVNWIYDYLLPWLGFIGFLWTCLSIYRWIHEAHQK
jgi:hypothetical protein